MAKFEREVDPQGELSAAERARRAEYLRRSYFQQLALKSARSRRKAKELVAEAAVAEKELAALDGDANDAA
jgi:hypothetical protein